MGQLMSVNPSYFGQRMCPSKHENQNVHSSTEICDHGMKHEAYWKTAVITGKNIM